MTECEAIERNELESHHKTNNSTVSGKTVTHKKRHGVKFRSATQKSDTTAKFYCTEHGQNPSHSTDKCFTLKNPAEKAKELSIRKYVAAVGRLNNSLPVHPRT